MNLALIPLLLVALLMAGADPGLDRAELLWDGRHEVVEHEGSSSWATRTSSSRRVR